MCSAFRRKIAEGPVRLDWALEVLECTTRRHGRSSQLGNSVAQSTQSPSTDPLSWAEDSARYCRDTSYS